MKINNQKKGTCEKCHREFPILRLFPLKLVRPSVLEIFISNHPEINKEGYFCAEDLRLLRTEYVERMLIEDKGALSNLEKQVIESLASQDILAENVNKKFERRLSFGEMMADKVAKFGGSWKFILSFFFLLIGWILVNALFFLQDGFDPYPFILLNLILSCLAAIQAPIIMMSQNRQAEKDRLQANEEYRTNLKAELEIQQLHAKLDLFMKRQWESLLELQKIQIELTEELIGQKKRRC